jgi:hypothetical protein
MSRFFTDNQEIVINFLNTHLAMVAFLMPWKRVSIEEKATGEVSHHLWTLFDLIHMKKDEWVIGMNNELDESLHAKSLSFLGVSVSLLFVTIVAMLANVFYPREIVPRFTNDVVAFLIGTTLLVLCVAFQSDFDAYWSYASKSYNAEYTYDWEQDFLVIGIIVGQLVLTLALLVDKYGDFMKQCRQR